MERFKTSRIAIRDSPECSLPVHLKLHETSVMRTKIAISVDYPHRNIREVTSVCLQTTPVRNKFDMVRLACGTNRSAHDFIAVAVKSHSLNDARFKDNIFPN